MPFPFRVILIIHFQLDEVLLAAALFKALPLTVATSQLSYGKIELEGLQRAFVFPTYDHGRLTVLGEMHQSPLLRLLLEIYPFIPLFFPNLFL